ncbi:hypothetical protein CIB93_35020 [Streptomyces sp. WZ.A104]|nr:hypothetical protein CIB93_35020 [Streptomyces sp. WZ.A104]
MCSVKRTKRTRAANGDYHGLSAWMFVALMLGGFVVVTVCALVGGWAGLIGIVVTAFILIALAAARL